MDMLSKLCTHTYLVNFKMQPYRSICVILYLFFFHLKSVKEGKREGGRRDLPLALSFSIS